MTAFGAGRRIKKFYSSVAVAGRDGRFVLLLDGREAKTPARGPLSAPTRALAEALAAEWEGAGETVDFDAMTLTRLASTAIDLASRDRAQWTEEVLKFLASDLVCYRADEPAALIERQSALWSPYVDWARDVLGAPLRVTAGVIAVEQRPALIAAARARLEAMDAWTLIGVKTAAEIAGSAVLALALEAGAFPPADVFKASRLDEHFQAERWGTDAEAAAREARLEAAFMAAARWLRLLKA